MKRLSRPCGLRADDRAFWSLLTDLLESGRQVRFNPAGTSMGPFIRQGDTVTVRPCSARDLGLGDVVLFTAGRGIHRVHRIVGFSRVHGRTLMITRGDASLDRDPPMSPEHILGKVSAVTKGRWTLDLDQPWGKAINWTWALFQRWPFSMRMLRTGGRLMKLTSHFKRSS